MSTLSHYEILEKIGEGGMGLVSLARDRRLGRLVALKQLRQEVCCGGALKDRFLAEARAASSLNHPNIITIFDIDSADGSEIIAMEYVKGKTLEQTIHRRPLPAAEALDYAVQIARALEAAHQAGIVHRDIKPANIMVSETGLIKVLDFGLAKLVQREPMSLAGTVSALEMGAGPQSQAGVVSGTPFYMSPEQAEGKEVDARTDIFAFGCVLYEMLTGQRAFQGKSATAVLSAILRDEPTPIGQLVPGILPELDRTVKRCLRKDPRRRWQQMPDLRIALEELAEEFRNGTGAAAPVVPANTGWRPGWALTGFAAAVLAAVGVAWWKNLQGTAQGPAKTAMTRLTSDPGLTAFPSISLDGTLVAYASDRAGEGNLDIWVQQLAGGEPIRLTRGHADEYEPVFSPDGSRIAFRSEADGGGLYIVSALGGEPRRVTQFGRSAKFSPDGQSLIYAIGSPGVGGAFAFGASSIHSVPAAGGEPRSLAAGFFSAHHPTWAADGKHVLFTGNMKEDPREFELWAFEPGSGAAPIDTGVLKALRAQGFGGIPEPFTVHENSIILPLKTGDTVNLWRLRLTRNQFRLAGQPEQLTFGTGLERLASMSRQGRLVFFAGQENSDLWELPVDANRGEVKGAARQLTRDAAEDSYPHLAANGSRIAFVSKRNGNDDVWTLETATGRASLLLSTPAQEFYPKLSRDGSIVAFGSISGARPSMFTMSTSNGVAARLCDDCGMVRDISNDGSQILMQAGPPIHIGHLDTAKRLASAIYRHPKYPVYAPKLSADEKWTAFQAVEQPTARTLYVAPFRGARAVPPEEWIKVTDGRFLDRNPYWSPDGRLLYFLSERDSFRCIWAQRLDPVTRRPSGSPFAVAHFHEAVRSLMNLDGPGQVSVSVGADRLVYSAAELTGNIWSTQLR